MTLVVDATVTVPAALSGGWSVRLQNRPLIAPSLLWSEVASALRQLEWRREISGEDAAGAIIWLRHAAIDVRHSVDLLDEAYRLATRLGWAKTYDTEYVALALQLNAPLVTLDARLRRTAARLVTVEAP